MSKVFVIPDIHLKPWILDEAEKLIARGDYDTIVSLGDLVDDWNHQYDLELYRDTLAAVAAFADRHPNFLFCYGNHDISYVWAMLESGYSVHARWVVLEGLDRLKASMPEDHIAFIHRIDRVLFSHAGLTKSFVSQYFTGFTGEIDELLEFINGFGPEELWRDASPIWARPQDGGFEVYPEGFLQVVGHTPVAKTLFLNGFLTVDNFSTYPNGARIGDGRFIWVDTLSKEWGFADQGGR